MKYFTILIYLLTFIDFIRKSKQTSGAAITEIKLGQEYTGNLDIIPKGLNNYAYYKLQIIKDFKEASKDLMIQVKPVQTYKSISDPDIYISKVIYTLNNYKQD
jgi:hypothetical protein